MSSSAFRVVQACELEGGYTWKLDHFDLIP